MAVAYQSYQSVSYATGAGAGSTLTCTKPTSLAVGDLLLAHFHLTSTDTVTVPSGWTTLINQISTGITDVKTRMTILGKMADSADVAASNFSFTISSGTNNKAMTLIRVTDYGKIAGSAYGIQNDSASTPVTFTGFTPELANCLMIIFTSASGAAVSGTYPSFSGYSIATNNPTWTEAYDFNYSPSDRLGMSMAYASRPEITNTGNVSVAISVGATADTVIGIIAVAPTLSATSTPDAIAITTRVDVLLSPTSSSLTVNSVTSTSVTQIDWTNETKPTATTWTNQDK